MPIEHWTRWLTLYVFTTYSLCCEYLQCRVVTSMENGQGYKGIGPARAATQSGLSGQPFSVWRLGILRRRSTREFIIPAYLSRDYNTFGMVRVAMLSLMALSVLLLQHGAHGTRVVTPGGDLLSCNFPDAMPGLELLRPSRAGRPPTGQVQLPGCRQGVDAAGHENLVDHLLQVLQNHTPLRYLLRGVRWLFDSSEPFPCGRPAAVSALNFYNIDINGHPDVAIVAEHEKQAMNSKTIRVWKPLVILSLPNTELWWYWALQLVAPRNIYKALMEHVVVIGQATLHPFLSVICVICAALRVL